MIKNHAKDDVKNHIDAISLIKLLLLSPLQLTFMFLETTIFYKFCWDQKLVLESVSIDSNRLWKAAGKPRRGTNIIFDKRQTYRRKIRESQQMNDLSYSNELHEALLSKKDPKFWKRLPSKFETSNSRANVTQLRVASRPTF
jgi:hypothetical protein